MRVRRRSLDGFFLLAIVLGIAFGPGAAVRAQDGQPPLRPPPNGPRQVDAAWHALVQATVHVAPGETVADATVVFRDGRIVSVGQFPPPDGARIWPMKGRHVYAGFIDAYVEADGEPLPEPGAPARHWNPKVTPARRALRLDPATAEDLRKLGFTAAAIAPRDGILRGRAALVSTAPAPDPATDPAGRPPPVYRRGVYQSLAFERTERSAHGYPTSLMGAIAVIRQALHDDLAPGETLLFRTEDELDALRAGKIAREFKKPAILLGSGLEFRRLEAIRADALPVIVPLRFPRTPRADGVGALDALDLRDLMTWEQAPANPARLDAAGVRIALTTSRLKHRRAFRARLRKARRHGLTDDRALAMLTVHPARILGVDGEMGTVARGKRANLVVADGPIFERGTKVLAVWTDGRRHAVGPPPGPPAAGTWTLRFFPPIPRRLQLEIPERGRRFFVRAGETRQKVEKGGVDGNRLRAVVPEALLGDADGNVALSGLVLENGTMQGHGVRADGARFRWSAERSGPPPEPDDEREDDGPATVGAHPGHPFGPYALPAPPAPAARVFVRGATIWTSGSAGIIENGELEARDGKIVYVGPLREAEPEAGDGVVVIDGAGRHLTPGLVDCHSHTGISRGVNDAGQAVTAEVRIGDVTNPDHISWYRQLAGGVTTVNSLHGSANPIGGQSQTNKVRWGAVHPDDMHMDGAAPGIKFALGENVKQSNWGDEYTTRYPQTRMGVEALIRDRFHAAREYAQGHDRVDLELEALAEVLAGTRLVHCHSYRQDEILMLCRVARDFRFTIGTFQHVLEGYKVARAIRENALGGSAFADWWAYKVEVQDAIPENGPIMHENGVVVSYNSDSDDLARRLNVEAAKAVKYGGLSPSEALKFVTLNPAKQLRIDHRVGSLADGKDADFVLWSADPLSVYARCEATWIDGREYFSLAKDRARRGWIAQERRRLLQKVLDAKRRADRDGDEEDDDGEDWDAPEPEAHVCGDCGTGGAR